MLTYGAAVDPEAGTALAAADGLPTNGHFLKGIPLHSTVDEAEAEEKLKDALETLAARSSGKTQQLLKSPSSMLLASQDRKVSLSWTGLSIAVRPKPSPRDVLLCRKPRAEDAVTVIHSCSGLIQPSQVLFIMGPSGSGKTTLLDALANRKRGLIRRVAGSIFYGGKQCSEKQRRSMMAYVTQEDSLLGSFTTRETLIMAARLHYGYRNVTQEFINERVNLVLSDMGLQTCADTLVGNVFFKGLSGGQQRRLSIAIELISNPSIIALDEPTSGLDSASAKAIVAKLRALAVAGHTIIASIHQPSSEMWHNCDRIMLLAQGKTVYFGPAKLAVPYFAAKGFKLPKGYNPADYLLDLIATDFEQDIPDRSASEDHIALLCEAFVPLAKIVETEVFKDCALYANEAPYRHQSKHAKYFETFLTLVWRNLINLARNPAVLGIRLVLYIMCAFMWGLVYRGIGHGRNAVFVQGQLSLLFSTTAFFTLMCVATLPFLVEERSVFLRERRNGSYAVGPFVWAFVVSNILPSTFVTSMSTSIVVWNLAALQGFGYYFLAHWAVMFTAEAFVFFLGAWVQHYIIGITLGAAFFAVCMTLENVFQLLSIIDWYLRWIAYVTPLRFCYRALMVNQFAEIGNLTAPGIPNGQALLNEYGINSALIQSIGGDIGIVVLFGLSYIWLSWLTLKFYMR